MAKWYIGCSGFHYKHWRGVFYPEGLAVKKWFQFYCEHFNTVEINVTFYRFPQVTFLKSWYQESPADFKFSVKVPRAITHFKKFVNAQDLLHSFYNSVNKGLKEKVGCILFQLPSRMIYTEEKLNQIIGSLDPAFPNVIEFRDESWWTAEVYRKLANEHITFSGISHPSLPRDVVVNNELVYYRFHGAVDLYKTPYSKNQLASIVSEIKSRRKAKTIFCYFNNDIDVNAPRDAEKLKVLAIRSGKLATR